MHTDGCTDTSCTYNGCVSGARWRQAASHHCNHITMLKTHPQGSLQAAVMAQPWQIKILLYKAPPRKSHPTRLPTPQVTLAIFGAIARNQAASSVLCAANDCCLHLVDVGVDADVSTATSAAPHITVHHAKLARGTASFLAGPAMTQEQCAAAIAEGRQAVDRVLSEMQGSDGADGAAAAAAAAAREGAPGLVLCIGELGIGNTTSAAALVAALTGAAPAEVCGRGTGGLRCMAA
jgi:NaMN:DMB phosphoribosyltransferase